MDKKEIFDRIEYVVVCVGAFAQRYNLSNSQAYAYLRRFTGIDFLLDCYAAEHTLSIDDAVPDLQVMSMFLQNIVFVNPENFRIFAPFG